MRFVPYRPDLQLDVGGRILLDPDGEELTAADRGAGLFLVDCAWRRVPTLLRTVEGPLVRRRVPHYQTVYPRKSKVIADPATGLASLEALYAATALLGEPRLDWLEGYHFADAFLRANPSLNLGMDVVAPESGA